MIAGAGGRQAIRAASLAALLLLMPAAVRAYVSIPRVGGLNGTSPTAAMVTSIYTNPAAIGQLRGHHVFLDVTPTYYAARFDRAGTSPTTGGPFSEVGLEYLTPVPFLGFTTDFHSDLVTLGVAAYVPFGRGGGWPERGPQRYELTLQDENAYYLHPAVSFRFGDNLMLGAGLAGTYVMLVTERSYDLARFFYDLGEEFLGVKFPEGTVPYEAPEWEAVIRNRQGGLAWGWNVGALVKPLDWLDVGLSYTSRVDVRLDGTFELELPTQPFALFGILELEKGVKNLLEDVAGIATPQRVKGKTTMWFTLPQNLVLGAAFHLSPRVLLDTWVRWTDWSQYRDLLVEFHSENSELELPKERVPFRNIPAWELSALLKVTCADDFGFGVGALYETDSIPERWSAVYNVNAPKVDVLAYFSWRVSRNVVFGLGYSQIHFFEKQVNESAINRTGSTRGRYLTEVFRLGTHVDIAWGGRR